MTTIKKTCLPDFHGKMVLKFVYVLFFKQLVLLLLINNAAHWFVYVQNILNCAVMCDHNCTVGESLHLSSRVCLNRSAARTLYASWLQSLSSSQSLSDNV